MLGKTQIQVSGVAREMGHSNGGTQHSGFSLPTGTRGTTASSSGDALGKALASVSRGLGKGSGRTFLVVSS